MLTGDLEYCSITDLALSLHEELCYGTETPHGIRIYSVVRRCEQTGGNYFFIMSLLLELNVNKTKCLNGKNGFQLPRGKCANLLKAFQLRVAVLPAPYLA
jgi:hypothetical protein